MVTLSNVLTSDGYTDAATLEMEGASSFTFDVYNASAYVSFRNRTGGVLQDFSAERLYGPVLGGFVTNCDGIRFRSAVSGNPARIVASGFGSADVQVIGGTPNTSALSASGGVSSTVALTGRVNANGTIAAGTGFTVNRTGVGVYVVTYTNAFSSTPVLSLSVTSLGGGASFYVINPTAESPSSFTVQIDGNATNATDRDWSFVATTTV